MACHPLIRDLRTRLAAGEFGTPRQVHADLGFVVPVDASERMWDPALGAGALLDMGIYPLTFARLMLGPYAAAVAAGDVSEHGVDLDVAIAARHQSGAVSALTTSMTSASPRAASVATDEGLLEVPADFHHPTYAVWTPEGGEPQRIEPPSEVYGTGLGNEAAHVQDCLARRADREPAGPPRADPRAARRDGRRASPARSQLRRRPLTSASRAAPVAPRATTAKSATVTANACVATSGVDPDRCASLT